MSEQTIYEELEILRYKLENLMNENIEQQKLINCLTNQLDDKKRLLDIVCSTTKCKKYRKKDEERQKKLNFYHENKSKIDINAIHSPQWQHVKKITDKMYVESLSLDIKNI